MDVPLVFNDISRKGLKGYKGKSSTISLQTDIGGFLYIIIYFYNRSKTYSLLIFIMIMFYDN